MICSNSHSIRKSKKMQYVTTAQEAAALLSSEMHSTDEFRHDVKIKDVTVVGSMRCSEHEAKAARAHATLHFPGKVLCCTLRLAKERSKLI